MEMTQFAMVKELALLVKDNLYCKHLVLSTEEAFVDFLENGASPDGVLELEPMIPYHRMLLHRLADIFGFVHESVGEGDDRHLVLERCSDSSIPSILVSDILWQCDEGQPTMTTHILRRKDLPELKKRETSLPAATTVEEREAAYLAARERIFALHDDEEKEPIASKPRNIPVVARRMIAHALGQSVRSNTSDQNLSQNSVGCGPAEEFHKEKEVCQNSSPDVTRKPTPLSSEKMQTRGRKLNSKHSGRNRSSLESGAETKLNRKESPKCSDKSKEVPSGSDGKVVGAQNLGSEQFGAAKRMFANALGLPSSKGLKCNEASKDSSAGC